MGSSTYNSTETNNQLVERLTMTKKELMERLESYSDDEQLAFIWFDKEEIGEILSDEEWNAKCDDLITSDTIKDIAESIVSYGS